MLMLLVRGPHLEERVLGENIEALEAADLVMPGCGAGQGIPGRFPGSWPERLRGRGLPPRELEAEWA